MTDRDDSVTALLASTAAVADDLASEVTVLRYEVLQLRAAIEARAPIEQARGMLMMRYGLSADAATHFLLRWSRNQHLDVHALADLVVHLLAPTRAAERSMIQPPHAAAADDVEEP